MGPRSFEAVILAVLMLAIAVGGRAFILQLSAFGGVAISALGVIAIFLVYAFRRNYLRGGPQVRLNATRDAAFLAGIAATIAFVATPARWSLGAAVIAIEFALAVELLSRFSPAAAGKEP